MLPGLDPVPWSYPFNRNGLDRAFLPAPAFIETSSRRFGPDFDTAERSSNLARVSIVTKTGDHGTTALMYQRRVSKCHPRVEAYGTVDELNSALGLARATVTVEPVRTWVAELQKHLIGLMGELATDVSDLPRYLRDGYPRMTPEITARVDHMVRELEAREIAFRGWALPGDTLGSGALDLGRTVCRRAERCVCALHEAGQLQNPEIIIFLNRLSDLLWLCGRFVDAQAPGSPGGAPSP